MMQLLSRRDFLGYWKNSWNIFGSVFLIIILNSCKTIPFSSNSEDRDFNQYLYKAYISDRSKYYSADVDITLKTENIQKIKGKVYINKGEYIYLNFSFLGIELARAEITPDSLNFINRFDKTYFFGKVEELQSIINIDLNYSQFETLILKGIIVDETDSKKRFKNRIVVNEESYIYLYDNKISVKSIFDKENFGQSKVVLGHGDSIVVLQAEFSDYYRDINYPKRIHISFSGGNSIEEADIIVGKISKDRNESGKFIINSRYREISF